MVESLMFLEINRCGLQTGQLRFYDISKDLVPAIDVTPGICAGGMLFDKGEIQFADTFASQIQTGTDYLLQWRARAVYGDQALLIPSYKVMY